MTLATLIAKTTIDPAFGAAGTARILAVLQTSYNGSATARAMFDGWLADPAHTIQVQFVAGKFQGFLSTGIIQIDLGQLTHATYIDPHGKAVQDTDVTAIMHELGHALEGFRDNINFLDYKGDNVDFVNEIYKELGLPEQISYHSYDSTGLIHKLNYDYTNGVAIDAGKSGNSDLSSWGRLLSDDLLIGGSSGNQLSAGLGNDFLVGAGGDDSLYGSFGTDTAVYFGNPLDYDIRKNADGSWTVRHARGAKDEGEDHLENIEAVQFSGGVKYQLKDHGLTFQTDFALVIDTTGSMGSSIGSVKAQATALINAAFAGGAADARIGVVGFKDTTNGEPSSVILHFTDQDSFDARKAAALAAINSITVGGGGDTPETAYDGLRIALDGHMGEWRAGAGILRIALFTDAPAKDGALAAQVTALAHSIGATISATSSSVAAGGSIDTFTLAYPGEQAAGTGRSGTDDPNADPDDAYAPLIEPIVPTGPTQVQIFTIFTGPAGTDTAALSAIATANSGGFLTAPTNDELINALLAIISAPPAGNVAPTDIALNSSTLAENSPGGTIVGTISVTDPDAGDTFTLALADPADPRFLIDAGKLVVAAGADIDFEDSASIGVAVTATDGAGHSFTKTLALTVTDVAESFIGTAGADTINGDAGANTITGLAGDDVLSGRRGNDLIQGGEGNDRLFGESGDDTLEGGAGDDWLAGGAGADIIRLGDGKDRVAGTVAELNGDQIEGFGTGDNITVQGAAFTRANLALSGAGDMTRLAFMSGGTEQGAVRFGAGFTGGDFMVAHKGGDSIISFEHFLPTLSEGSRVDAGLVQGIANQAYLSGDTSSTFIVKVEGISQAKLANSLGVYEIDAAGQISDVRILAENARFSGGTFMVTGVEAGHQLGFFIVQNGANTLAPAIAASSTLSLVAQGGKLALAENGAVLAGVVSFFSHDAGANADGMAHALSGVSNDGSGAIRIGFEDLLRDARSDDDFQDLVISVLASSGASAALVLPEATSALDSTATDGWHPLVDLSMLPFMPGPFDHGLVTF